MPTIFKKGDILNTEGLHAYAHACNVAGTMDSGISLAFKKRWPAMFDEVQKKIAEKRPQMGDLFTWSDRNVTVFGLVIQESASKKAKMTALSRSLTSLVEHAKTAEIDRVGIGRIGAGAAALDWTRVKKVLADVAEDAPLTLEVFEQFVRAKADP